MASPNQTEKEHNHFCRYSRLVLEVAPSVLRRLLVTRALHQHNVQTIDDVLADTTVSNTLQYELSVKKKVLRQHQLDLLYPPGGDNVDINKWDITLLCVLFKNICTLTPQEMAYVDRIRMIRNSTYGHIAGASLSNQDYNTYWTDLSSAIDDIVKAINDQAFLKETNDFVTFIQHERDIDLLEEIVKTWKQDEDDFVLTRACKNAQHQLETNNIVTLTGVSGSGKSGIAHHIALGLGEQGYTIYAMDRADDIKKYGDISSKQVFVLDDPIGKHEVDWSELRQFEKLHKTITSLTSRDVKLILTCRKNILNDEKCLSYKTVIGMGLIDLTDKENNLVEDEKRCILEKYAKQARISATDLNIIVQKSYPNFPLLCKVFAANFAEFGKHPIKYFSEPFSFLLEELKIIKQRDEYQYCSLILCLVFENSFDINCLDARSKMFKKSSKTLQTVMCLCGLSEDEPLNKIEQAFKSLTGVYFIQEETRFRFIHDFLFDVVAHQFGTDHPCEMLKLCKSNFIREHVRTPGVKTNDELVIRIKEAHYKQLTKRFYSDLHNGDFHDVFLNPSLNDSRFVEAFCEYTRTMATDEILKVYFKTEPNLEKFKSTGLITEFCWDKQRCILSSLDTDSTRAIHWVLAYNMFAIFRVCHATLKTFRKIHTESGMSRFRAYVNSRTGKGSLVTVACLSGNTDMLKILLQDKFKVKQKYEWFMGHGCANALHMAAISGNIDMVKKVINAGIDINSRVEFTQFTSLFLSASLGYTQVCEYLLQNGAKVSLFDTEGVTPLYMVSQDGHIDTLKVLLQHAAKVNRCNNAGVSPLHAAASKGQTKAVSILLNAGADVKRYDNDGNSALGAAAKNGHIETVSVLLDAGADISHSNNKGVSALFLAAQNGHTAIVSALLQAGADVNHWTNMGTSALCVAASNGHTGTLHVLLQAGADVHLCTNTGLSPLAAAASNGHTETLSVLLEVGADVNLYEQTSGLMVAYNKHTDTVSILPQTNANVNRCNKSALFLAAKNGHTDTVDTLLHAGAHVNRWTNEGLSPLFVAARNGHTNVVSQLIKAGANVHHCIDDGSSALFVAAQCGHTATVTVLLEAGAEVSHRNNKRVSPLVIATLHGHPAVVSVLIQAGANLNRHDNNWGLSPLHIAAQHGHRSIVKILVDAGADANNRDESRGDKPYKHAYYKLGQEDIADYLIACKRRQARNGRGNRLS